MAQYISPEQRAKILSAIKDEGMSVKRASELTHTMYELVCTLPDTIAPTKIVLQMDKEQRMLYDVIRKK
ncbi:MAG: hypothetical protein G01um101448_78 [Parcubacteria group bacterium Gr01-1014_48]|nr:MAG: hypothetical protein Greene041614_160 [Parcubacteria group bacterium Greene0416_14]TSC74559.1 MAG: hypothetical protein G01um101448_78 [Parcubacteria group bacterium Gr01-1014_48]TSD01435.1 MAG: hypothetical protein Greene101415_282 [Parcubacteria group bacterium Greene1014_15]